MIWIIYASDAVSDMPDDALRRLLSEARANNSRRGVTGMLLYRDRRFLQVLEGEEGAVRERLEIIRADQRHRNLRVLLDEPIARRQFPAWTMGFPAISSEVAGLPGFRASFGDLDLEKGEHTIASWALLELARAFQVEKRR